MLFGQSAAERTFYDAAKSGRLHHAWLLCGPRGVGKATLAWRIARALRAASSKNLSDKLVEAAAPEAFWQVDPDHPVARQIAAGSEPYVRALTRTVNERTGRLRTQIVIEDVRALAPFFQFSIPDGGWRVVIIDPVDEMNAQAANALLKMLEEPPERTLILLVAHQPARLLPTIRSRCRSLRLAPLEVDDMNAALGQAGFDQRRQEVALTELAAGSVGTAIWLVQNDGLAFYADLIALLGTLPRTDRARALSLSERAAQRGAPEQRDLIFALLDVALTRLARTGAQGAPPQREAAAGEGAILARLAPTPHPGRAWAAAAQAISARVSHGLAVNLDPAALVLDTVRKLTETARGHCA